MPCTHAVPLCQAGSSYQLEPSMDRYRAPKAKPDHAGDADDSDELAVFAAERYFYGDDDDDAALWPWERSSSSLSSSAFRTGTHDHDRSASVPTPTAVTSSSEASWNSRSALLPTERPAEKSHAVADAATTPIIEASASGVEGQLAGRRPAASSSSSNSNQLRRWLLGVAACACASGGSGESVSAADEMETSERLPEAEIPEATAARSSATPESGRWLLEGDRTALAGMDGHRRATNKGEWSTPILEPRAAATSDSDERRRIKSLEMLRPVPVPVGDRGRALGSATQSSRFTILAENTALGGHAPRAATAGGGVGSPGEDDDDDAAPAPSELGCAYPPSEASVVWSVVTADGAASGNFSSAASGYYYHYCFNDVNEGTAMRRAAARNTHKRRSGIPGGSSLLMCMSDKAVDAVGPARSVHRQEVLPAAVPTLGASGGGGRNRHGGVYKPIRT